MDLICSIRTKKETNMEKNFYYIQHTIQFAFIEVKKFLLTINKITHELM